MFTETREHKAKLIDLMSIYSLIQPDFFPQARKLVLETFQELCTSQEVSSEMLPFILSSVSRYVDHLDQQFIQTIPAIVGLIAQRLQLKESDVELYNEISVYNPYVEEKCFLLNVLFTIT